MKEKQQNWDEKCVPKLGLNMSTRTEIKHVYQGVQGVCPQQAVTSTRGMAECSEPHAVGAGLKLVDC